MVVGGLKSSFVQINFIMCHNHIYVCICIYIYIYINYVFVVVYI